jgi:hypothetical protein
MGGKQRLGWSGYIPNSEWQVVFERVLSQLWNSESGLGSDVDWRGIPDTRCVLSKWYKNSDADVAWREWLARFPWGPVTWQRIRSADPSLPFGWWRASPWRRVRFLLRPVVCRAVSSEPEGLNGRWFHRNWPDASNKTLFFYRSEIESSVFGLRLEPWNFDFLLNGKKLQKKLKNV